MKKERLILILLLILLLYQLMGVEQQRAALRTKINGAVGREKVDLLLELAKLELESDLDKSWQADSLALELAEQSRYLSGSQRGLLVAGRIELARQNYWQAIEYFTKAQEVFAGHKEDFTGGIIKNNIALANSKLGWTDKAIKQLEEAEKIFLGLPESNEVRHELAITYMNWGLIELELGNFESSLSHLLSGMQEVEKINEPQLEATIKGNIGRVYQSLMNPALSLEYYRQALAVHKEINNTQEMAVVYGNMGTLYSELEDYQKALEYYELSWETYKTIGNNLGVASVLGNIGNLYYFQGELDKTLDYYQQAVAIVESIGATVYQAYLLNNLGAFYIEMGNYVKAKEQLETAEKLAKELNVTDLEAEIYATYGDLYREKKDYLKALEYNELEASLKDSIFAETTAEQIAEMQTKYDTERKERENVLLRKDNEIKELEIGKKEMQRNSLFIISGLVILLVIIVYKRYRSKKKSAEILADKNALITSQKEELSETLDELKRTQKQLVESEKMASLGSLVTGVAHEINTPVGIIITAVTNLADRLKALQQKYQINKMKKSDLDGFLVYTEKASNLILSNSQRTGELVKSFKKVSVDQSTESKRQFKIKSYINDVLMSLEPKFKGMQVEVSIDCDEYLVWNSYPGIVAQIVTNLVINSLVHAFARGQEGKIEFFIKRKDAILEFVYADNGKGMSKEVQSRIFDPFFTTNKQTGTGLGMHIIYNLITQKLNGTIEVESAPGEGTKFIMEYPFVEGGLFDL